ncbi:MAG: acetoacetate--CoA ligase [Burkholderiaceae bacterium]
MTDTSNPPAILWRPGPERLSQAHLTHFTRWLGETRGKHFGDYESLWRWSTDSLEEFWAAIWDYFEIQASQPYEQVLRERRMPGAQWFVGARLNYAQHLLARSTEADSQTRAALVFRSETVPGYSVSWADLAGQTGALMNTMRDLGVRPGDRVCAYMPNIPQTAVAVLASAGIGAVWSSCSPDMGSVGVLDRFRQIAPTVLVAVDGYRYGGKDYDRRAIVRDLIDALPSLRAVILVPYLDQDAALEAPTAGAVRILHWSQAVAEPAIPVYEQVAFDHPLWVVYSSGTTGMPKAIVHGHGGALLEGLKGNALHLDLGRDDRFFWFSSTSWIMWNLWLSTLARGCTALHFDGNPGYPDLDTLWHFAAQEKATFFGTSPAFLALNMKAGVEPARRFDLSALRTLGATGSPLSVDAYQWIYEHVGQDLLLASISGGTDPLAAFLTASATLPVRAGEMQCRSLGCAVQSFDDEGQAGFGRVGELVVTQPMPSMPLRFWGDDDGERYRTSYFEPWPGVWRHGDWLTLFERPEAVTSVVYGRSDSTINRHGIRMGTAELYRVVEGFDEILDSLVIDLEYLGKASRLLLFVVLRDSAGQVPPELARRICSALREQLSARHVPDDVIAIREVPRTMSGKKLEVPVKRILLGHSPQQALNRDAMANPASIDWFIDFASAAG